jgi:thymidylate kinase
LGEDRVRKINETGLDGVIPNHVFVLDVDPGTALGRQHREDRIGGEGAAFQEAVREGYRALGQSEPETVTILDGSKSVEVLVDLMMERLQLG